VPALPLSARVFPLILHPMLKRQRFLLQPSRQSPTPYLRRERKLAQSPPEPLPHSSFLPKLLESRPSSWPLTSLDAPEGVG
jgi:hypothetical protein